MLVLISPASLKSHWVPFEIGQATSREKTVLPYLTHQSLELPLFLANLNYARNTESLRNYFQQQKSVLVNQELEAESLDYASYLDGHDSSGSLPDSNWGYGLVGKRIMALIDGFAVQKVFTIEKCIPDYENWKTVYLVVSTDDNSKITISPSSLKYYSVIEENA